MSTHNIGFYEEISEIIPNNYHQISSDTHLICSSGTDDKTKNSHYELKPLRFFWFSFPNYSARWFLVPGSLYNSEDEEEQVDDVEV